VTGSGPRPDPVVAMYRVEDVLRHTIDCTPTHQPGVCLVSEPIEAADGEAVVFAIDPDDLWKVHTRQQLKVLEARGDWPPKMD
jgi:hypothetical protein